MKCLYCKCTIFNDQESIDYYMRNASGAVMRYSPLHEDCFPYHIVEQIISSNEESNDVPFVVR